MSGVPQIPAFDPLFGFDPDARDAGYHLSEVLRAMPAESLDRLLADIRDCERGAALTEAIGDTLRRAACHAEAERIYSRFSAVDQRSLCG